MVWVREGEEAGGVGFIEDDDSGYEVIGCEHEGTIILRDDGPGRAFEELDGAIGVDANYEGVGEPGGVVEVVEVAGVEEVEAAVCCDNGATELVTVGTPDREFQYRDHLRFERQIGRHSVESNQNPIRVHCEFGCH